MSDKLFKQLTGTETEYKCYGLYSYVAEHLGCSISDVDSVYSWYLETNLKGIIDEDTLQVMFRDLGTLKINLSKAMAYLQGYVTSLEGRVNMYYEKNAENPSRYTFKTLAKRYDELEYTIKTLRTRIDKMHEKALINETGHINKVTRLEKIEKQLNSVYESIQRIPEYEHQRTAECRQGVGGDDNEGDKEF